MNNAVGCLTISRMPDCLPCRKEVPYPIVSAESVPSLIANLTYALYGTIAKSLVAGKIVWNIPCDPNNTAQIANIPRLPEEGLLCYFIRVIQGSSYNGIWSGTGAPTGNPATVTALPGDFYIDAAAHYLYGPLTSGGWPAGVSLIGPAGATGPAGSNGNWSTPQAINTQTGTTYTLQLADAGNLVTLNNSGAITLNITTDGSISYPTGTRYDICQLGAGRVTITPVSGVTINSANGLITRAEYSCATLVKLSYDTWLAVGDLAVS